jgi:CBS domain-containing protein
MPAAIQPGNVNEGREAVRDTRQKSPGRRVAGVPKPLRGDLRSVAVTTVMSHPVLAVRASAYFSDALHALVTHGLRHLAVVDEAGRCVGLLTDRAVAAEWAGRPMAFVRRAVASACGGRQPIVDRNATVTSAARMMHRCGTDAVIVINEDRRPLGILTGGDVIALLAKPDREETKRHAQP